MSVLRYLKRVAGVFGKPSSVFEEVAGEALYVSVVYLLITTMMLSIILVAVGVVFVKMFLSPFFENKPFLQWVTLPVLAVMVPIFGLAVIFILGLVLHVFAFAFGGRSGLGATLKAVIYASTPSILSFWFPPLFAAGVLWSVLILFKGLRKLQKISNARVIASLAVPLLVFGAFFLIIRRIR